MWINPQFYVDIFTFTKEILNKKSHFFVHWSEQVNRQKITVKKKIIWFLKNDVASLFTFFEKVLEICTFFTDLCLDVRFWDLLYLICLKFNHFFFAVRKCVNLVVIFNKERDLYKTAKLCLLKIFILCWTTKVNCHEFYCFILNVKWT